MKKWFRVIDPLNPLYGSDVTGHTFVDMGNWLAVTGMRRVDVFVGDRPFQLMAPEGQSLGLLIDCSHLKDSPIQVETFELGDDRPFGRCIDESDMTRADGLALQVVRYEHAQQVALRDGEAELLASRTFTTADGADTPALTALINSFAAETSVDDLVYQLKRRD